MKICKDHGVNKVLVLSITCRPGHPRLVEGLNNILRARQLTYDYELIYNENITADFIWKDRLHLSNRGTDRLTSNFRRILNGIYLAHAMQPYNDTSPTLNEHIPVEHGGGEGRGGEGRGGVESMDTDKKNPEEICIPFNQNNNNQINRCALLEQDVNSISSELLTLHIKKDWLRRQWC